MLDGTFAACGDAHVPLCFEEVGNTSQMQEKGLCLLLSFPKKLTINSEVKSGTLTYG